MGHKKIDNKKIYNHYFEAVTKRCQATHYAKGGSSRNEEFAEVFALYLTDPDELQKFPTCKPAIKYFAKLFGEAAATEDITCENRKSMFSALGHFQAPTATEPSSDSGVN